MYNGMERRENCLGGVDDGMGGGNGSWMTEEGAGEGDGFSFGNCDGRRGEKLWGS